MSISQRKIGLLIIAWALIGSALAAPPIPLASGEYSFEMRDEEFPNLPGTPIRVLVNGTHIKIVSESPGSTTFPAGTVVDEGFIIWNLQKGQWIVGDKESDATAVEVGGCSEGPAIIDLDNRVYWWC